MTSVVSEYPIVPPPGKVVTLDFDPEATDNLLLREIFQHRWSWLMWLGLRWRHIVSQYFADDCWAIGHRVEHHIARRSSGQMRLWAWNPGEAVELLRRCWWGNDPIFGWGCCCGDAKDAIPELAYYVEHDAEILWTAPGVTLEVLRARVVAQLERVPPADVLMALAPGNRP